MRVGGIFLDAQMCDIGLEDWPTVGSDQLDRAPQWDGGGIGRRHTLALFVYL